MQNRRATRVLDGHNEPNLSTGVGGDGGVGVTDRGVEGGRVVHHSPDEREVEPLAFSLRADDASLLQCRLHCVVEGVRVEALCRTFE